MFDFSTSTGITMTHFREWAGEIANSYLSAGAIPTDTLVKIAKSEDLSPSQVEILAAEVNKTIHNIKYASASEKYHAADFPLADAKIAIQKLQIDGGPIKIAAQFSEPVFDKPEIDLFKAFGIPQDVEMDKTASIKQQSSAVMEKTALLRQKINDKLMEIRSESELQKSAFIKQARQCMIDESNSLDRMKVLGMFDHFVKAAQMPHGKKLLAKVAYVMMKEGKLEPGAANKAISYFTKEGDCKAPEELISQNLPGQVINGDHPLYITLKTIGDLDADYLRYENQGLLIDDKVRILGQKVRAL